MIWGKVSLNLGYYHTKYHSTKHHQEVRPLYIYQTNTHINVNTDNQGGLRGFVDL